MNKSSIDKIYMIIVNTYTILCILLSAIIISLHINIYCIIVGIIGILFPIFSAYLFYSIRYLFTKDSLIIKIGPFKKIIEYADIKKCFITINNVTSYAASLKRIAIVCQNETVYISPVDLDKALAKLIEKKKGSK